MTLGTGTVYFSEMRTEFGGSNPVAASQYYRGGARVPNTPTNAAVPTSGTWYASLMRGTSAYSYVSISASGHLGNSTINGSWSGPVVTLTVPAGTGTINLSYSHTDGSVYHNGGNVGLPSSLSVSNGNTIQLRKVGPGSAIGVTLYDATSGASITSGYGIPP